MVRKLFIFLIKLYRKFVSPMLGRHCRFSPTCSHYAMIAITKYGAFKGAWMTAKRILRCNPFCKGGYDPVK